MTFLFLSPSEARQRRGARLKPGFLSCTPSHHFYACQGIPPKGGARQSVPEATPGPKWRGRREGWTKEGLGQLLPSPAPPLAVGSKRRNSNWRTAAGQSCLILSLCSEGLRGLWGLGWGEGTLPSTQAEYPLLQVDFSAPTPLLEREVGVFLTSFQVLRCLISVLR